MRLCEVELQRPRRERFQLDIVLRVPAHPVPDHLQPLRPQLQRAHRLLVPEDLRERSRAECQ